VNGYYRSTHNQWRPGQDEIRAFALHGGYYGDCGSISAAYLKAEAKEKALSR